MTLRLNDFACQGLNDYFRMLIVGASGSGKTLFACTVFNHYLYNKYQHVLIFTTPDSQHYFTEKKGYKLNNSASHIYWWLEGDSKKTAQQCISKALDLQSRNKDQKMLIIFDDIIDPSLAKSKEMKQLFARGRNSRISTMFLAQNYNDFVGRCMRNNSSHLCLFNMGAEESVLKWQRSVVCQDIRLLQLDDKTRKTVINSIMREHIFKKYHAVILHNSKLYRYN